MAVSPDDEKLLYFPSVAFTMSRDGGTTVFQAGGGGGGGRWRRTADAEPAAGAADGGPQRSRRRAATTTTCGSIRRTRTACSSPTTPASRISDNRAATYQHFLLPISQVYHVMADNAIPYNVMGNIQDKSIVPRTQTRAGGGARRHAASATGRTPAGARTRSPCPIRSTPNIVWSGCDNGRIVRMDYKHGMARDVSPWPITSYGWAPADMKYRWDWITPIAISPHDHNRVYVGAQVVFMTTDGGQSWKVISPDLTTNDKVAPAEFRRHHVRQPHDVRRRARCTRSPSRRRRPA